MDMKRGVVEQFIKSAPPGELANVVAGVKALAEEQILDALDPAFKKYNEEQYVVVKVQGVNDGVLLSQHNALEDDRYFDTASQTSFEVDHPTQKTSNTQQHPLESKNADIIRSLQKAFSTVASEHFPTSTIGIYPANNDTQIAILLVANKYSPQNFWNGRWRSTYILDPSSNSISGSIQVDVHYYEDGNVRMATSKKVEINAGSGAESVVRGLTKAENAFQEQLNRGFGTLAEGSFKGLRRQLPVTRQRVEWEKIGGYRLGQDVAGGRQR